MQALQNFKTYFFRGLATLLPTILTVWIFVQLYLFIQHNVSAHINRGVVRVLVYSTPYYPYLSQDDLLGYIKDNFPAADNPQMLEEKIKDPEVRKAARLEKAEKFWVYGSGQIAGLLIAFVIVIFVGAFFASFIGRTFWRMFEQMLVKVPLIRLVYPNVKQVTDFFLSKEKPTFSSVVAVEYPRKGAWTIGMVTGSGLKEISKTLKKEYLTVLVPTSPTPFTGFITIVPKEEVIELSITVEDAIRFIVSGGVISPAAFESYKKNEPGQLENK